MEGGGWRRGRGLLGAGELRITECKDRVLSRRGTLKGRPERLPCDYREAGRGRAEQSLRIPERGASEPASRAHRRELAGKETNCQVTVVARRPSLPRASCKGRRRWWLLGKRKAAPSASTCDGGSEFCTSPLSLREFL